MVRSYLSATRHVEGLVYRSIAIATAKALSKRNPQFNLDHFFFGNNWAKSLFFRMGYVRRAKTTSTVQIPEAVQKEAELIFQHKIAKIVEVHQIPNCMILNLDQTPSKFVPSSNTTLAPFGTKSIPVTGLSDKRAITATFTMKLSMNPKHFSNTAEALKIIDEIIVPYLTKKRMGYTFLNITHLYL